MQKIKWSETVTNEEVFKRIGEKRMFLNNIMRRKVNWIGHIPTEIAFFILPKNRRQKLKQQEEELEFFDDLRNRRIYWELEEEAEDR